MIRIKSKLFEQKEVEVWVKRDDLTHSAVSGNKFRKLKYNLQYAKSKNFKGLVSFGGAYSNHIYALAAAAKLFQLESIGIIRGDELNEKSSPTLRFAHEQGMQLIFVSRHDYRDKQKLLSDFDKGYYQIPEGGSNHLALKGCAEMTQEILDIMTPSHICLAAGTGGTTAGIISNQNFLGQTYCFPVLKNGGFIKKEVENLLGYESSKLDLFTHYHFGGYAKENKELRTFISDFEDEFNFQIDQVYTGKLFYGVFDLIKKNHFKSGSKILIYHSGGLQGKSIS